MNREIVLLTVAVFVVTALFCVLGATGNAPFCGLFAGIAVSALIMVAFHSYFNPVGGGPLPARAIQVRHHVHQAVYVILLVTVPFLLIGLVSPKLNKSLNRRGSNTLQAVDNFLNKGSLNAEAESGIFGVMNADSGIYDRAGVQYTHKGKEVLAPQGMKVKAADLDGVKCTEIREGFTRVIIPNNLGDFVAENVVYIPSRKISWD